MCHIAPLAPPSSVLLSHYAPLHMQEVEQWLSFLCPGVCRFSALCSHLLTFSYSGGGLMREMSGCSIWLQGKPEAQHAEDHRGGGQAAILGANCPH